MYYKYSQANVQITRMCVCVCVCVKNHYKYVSTYLCYSNSLIPGLILCDVCG